MKIPTHFLLRGALALSVAVTLPSGCGTTTGSYATPRVALKFQGTRPGTTTGLQFLTPLASRLLAAAAPTPTSIDVKDHNGTLAGTLTLTDARLVMKEIRIGDDTVRFAGPYLIDLLASQVTPDPGEITLAAGTYVTMRMKLDKIVGGETDAVGNPLVASSDPLFGNSIYLAGTYTGNTAGGTATNMPFVLTFDIDEDFTLAPGSAAARGFDIQGGVTNTLIVAFRLARWFSFSDPDTNGNLFDFSAVQPASGQIILDKNAQATNQNIRAVIEKNIKRSADYGKDSDGDGKLSSKEDDDPTNDGTDH